MRGIEIYKPYLMDGLSGGREGKPKNICSSSKLVHKLSSNENLFGTSPKVIDAIISNLNHINEYPQKACESLKVALSKFYNFELQPDNFFCSNGGTGILELMVTAFLEKDQECIYSQATFEPFAMFPNKVGAIAINVPLLGNQFELNVEGILDAITDKTRVIWLCNPNNPTGKHIPKTKLDFLIDNIPEHIVVVYDEVYSHYADASDYTTALPYVLEGKNVIGVNSLSKVFGMAGLRVGYGYASQKLSNYLNKAIRPFLINKISTEAAIAALGDIDFVEHTKRMVSSGKNYLYEELRKLNIIFWESQTNFILIKIGMDSSEFERKMLGRGIMIRPVYGFETSDYIRVTVGAEESNIAFIEALKEILIQQEQKVL